MSIPASNRDLTLPRRRRGHIAAVILASVAGFGFASWGVYDAAIKPHVSPKRFGVVEQGKIYRSGELTPAATRLVVEQHGIRTIIDLGAHEPDTREERLAQRTADALNVTRISLDLEGDATGNPNNYVVALRVLNDPERWPILIHCAAGAQRTGCAVALFRMINEGWTFERALDEAKEFNHDPRDNPKLTEMIEKYREPIEAALEAGGQIPGIPAVPEPRKADAEEIENR
jgi:protein tyrosine/serine phosphatase